MLHPLIATVIQRPDLVVEHVAAYASLINQEAKTAGSQILRRSVSWALAIICGSIFVSLSGVALMLGFLQGQFHWILLAVPGTALILTVIAVHDARKALPTEHFPELKAQLDSDALALRMVA
jgi:hypothetical protein